MSAPTDLRSRQVRGRPDASKRRELQPATRRSRPSSAAQPAADPQTGRPRRWSGGSKSVRAAPADFATRAPQNHVSLLPRISHPHERQDACVLASVHWTFVRFGLDRKRVTLDGKEAHLIGFEVPQEPLNFDVMDDPVGRDMMPASDAQRCLPPTKSSAPQTQKSPGLAAPATHRCRPSRPQACDGGGTVSLGQGTPHHERRAGDNQLQRQHHKPGAKGRRQASAQVRSDEHQPTEPTVAERGQAGSRRFL